MAGETITYITKSPLRGECSCGMASPQWYETKEGLDERMIGHLIYEHGWSQSAAEAYAGTKVYTAGTVTNP